MSKIMKIVLPKKERLRQMNILYLQSPAALGVKFLMNFSVTLPALQLYR